MGKDSALSSEPRPCTPTCEFFRCAQRALVLRKGTAYCKWADDVCEGPKCNYASCLRGKLLSNGMCGMYVRRKTYEEARPEDEELPAIRISGRALRKLKEQDLI